MGRTVSLATRDRSRKKRKSAKVGVDGRKEEEKKSEGRGGGEERSSTPAAPHVKESTFECSR